VRVRELLNEGELGRLGKVDAPRIDRD
jgi:hypothetical protein